MMQTYRTPRRPPKPARRQLDLIEVGRRSVTNLDTGEVLSLDDFDSTPVAAFELARRSSPSVQADDPDCRLLFLRSTKFFRAL